MSTKTLLLKHYYRRQGCSIKNAVAHMVVRLRCSGLVVLLIAYGEKKTDKGKSHKGIWRSDAPEACQGQTRDVPGTPGTFGPDLCVNQY